MKTDLQSPTLLALELSSKRQSVCILPPSGPPESRAWETTGVRNQAMFAHIHGLLASVRRTLADLDLLVVGTGPGSFSGIRCALAYAQAASLPERRPVAGVCSARTIAYRILTNGGAAENVAVVGDARRNRLWVARYFRRDHRIDTVQEPVLATWDEFRTDLAPGTTVVSPDWERLADRLDSLSSHNITLRRQPVSPRAEDAAAIAIGEWAENDGCFSMPRPIYLHPPVFVKPCDGSRPCSPPAPSCGASASSPESPPR